MIAKSPSLFPELRNVQQTPRFQQQPTIQQQQQLSSRNSFPRPQQPVRNGFLDPQQQQLQHSFLLQQQQLQQQQRPLQPTPFPNPQQQSQVRNRFSRPQQQQPPVTQQPTAFPQPASAAPTSKQIVNPLLQKLFNKGEIQFNNNNRNVNPTATPTFQPKPQLQPTPFPRPRPTPTVSVRPRGFPMSPTQQQIPFNPALQQQEQQFDPQRPSQPASPAPDLRPLPFNAPRQPFNQQQPEQSRIPSLPEPRRQIPRPQPRRNPKLGPQLPVIDGETTFEEVVLSPRTPPQPDVNIMNQMNKQDGQSQLLRTLLEQKREKERKLKAILGKNRKQPILPIPAVDRPVPGTTPEHTENTLTTEIGENLNNPLFQTLLKQKQEKDRKLKAILRGSSSENMSRSKVFIDAKNVVERRKTFGRSKSSPEVWAAVKILTDFVEREEEDNRDIPQHIIMAIIQLTEFLDQDEKSVQEQSSLTPRQEKIREEILQQTLRKKQQISQILNNNRTRVEQKMISIVESSRTAPSSSFSFDTLPVV